MKITEEEIKRICSATIYRHGLEYFKEGRVHLYVRDENELVSVVDGEELYNVSIHLDDEGRVTDSLCTCPYYTTMNCTCKHIVATLKLRQKELSEGNAFSDENDRIARHLCKEYDIAKKNKIHLNLALSVNVNETPSGTRYYISIMIGEGVPEQVSSIERFLLSYAGVGEYKLTKAKSFTKDKYEFSSNDDAILTILAESCQNRTFDTLYKQKVSSVEIGAITFERIMPYLIKAHTEFTICGMHLNDMRVWEENPDVQIDVRAVDTGITVSVSESGFAIVPDGSWFFFGGDIYRTDLDWRNSYMPLYRALNGGSRTQIEFIGENRGAFASEVLPVLRTLNGAAFEGIDDIVISNKPTFDVYFDTRGLSISAVIVANYGSIPIRMSEETVIQDKIILRDAEAENRIMRHFGSFYLSGGSYTLDDSDEIYKFIFSELPELEREANIIVSDKFSLMRERLTPEIRLNVNYKSGIDLLEVGFETEMTADEIDGILSAVRLRKSYYRSKDGRFISLDDKKTVAELMARLDFDTNDIASGYKRVSKYYALYLDSLAKSGKLESDEAFDRLIEEVRSIKADIPDGISVVLREYQRDGVNWLAQLDELGFGGILADDMGLGKTLEVIAFVMSRKREKPALVVTPSTLMYNWLSEIRRFAPDAKAVIIDGAKDERAEKVVLDGDEDFVITSYPLLRRDLHLYKEMEFSYCFIDEAQYIKNPKTMNARSVKQIKAGRKYALTGTPVENKLTELWSIFDFVMPGYFGERRKFTEEFERPIQAGYEDAAKHLRARIKPFVMRRMKKDVLSELPDKIENTIFAELMPQQKKLYEAYLSVAKREAERILEDGAPDMMILSLLTRLRQICCHPSLFDESYDKESGKLELLCELITSAILSGHRVLVFSQFTSMLHIIREKLSLLGIEQFYLDGKTPSEERTALADRFNAGEGDVFLVSLKAGGTGLNLVGADTVIHYDPWWNPAVTDQASDRAYRIGQKRAVQVIRLATSGTIEEQILKLQDKKRAVADDIITKNSASLSNLSKEEILSLFE